MEETNVDPTPTETVDTEGQSPEVATDTPRMSVDDQRRQSFIDYWSQEGKSSQVPEKFKDAGAWFDSLQSAEKALTQKSQEVAELKKQLEQTSTTPSTQTEEPETAPEEASDKPMSVMSQEKVDEAVEAAKVTEAQMESWRNEFIMNNGEFTDAMRDDIQKALGVPKSFVNDMERMYKSQIKEANTIAYNMVGGKENLDAILKYANETLPPSQQESVSRLLNDPNTWETTLLGLKAKWEARPQAPKEPERKTTGVPANAVASKVQPFATRAEMYSAEDAYKTATNPKERDRLYKVYRDRLETSYEYGGNSLRYLS